MSRSSARRQRRERQYLQQGGQCWYCSGAMALKVAEGAQPPFMATLEHLIQRAHKGTYGDDNTRAVCSGCNNSRPNGISAARFKHIRQAWLPFWRACTFIPPQLKYIFHTQEMAALGCQSRKPTMRDLPSEYLTPDNAKAFAEEPTLETARGILEAYPEIHTLAGILFGEQGYQLQACAENLMDVEIMRSYFIGACSHESDAQKELRGGVLYGIDRAGTIHIAVYNLNPEHTPDTMMAKLNEAIALAVVPFQTWFGWGRDGVPTALSTEERKLLSPHVFSYVAAMTHPNAVDPDLVEPLAEMP